MESNTGKRHIEEQEEEEESMSEDEDSSEDEDEEMGEDEELGENDREVQVEFTGQNPCPEDFDGVKRLLQQLFLKAHINVSGLAELIVQQNYVGSVLLQCPPEDEEGDEEDSQEEEVFGVTSVINITHHKDLDCVKDLKKYFVEKAKTLSDVISNEANQIGFLLNERFINIPPHVSAPLLENLSKEIDEAKKSGKPFDFTHFIMISKLHEPTRKDGEGKKKKVKGDSEILWVNAEEEPICEIAEVISEYSVRNESDSAVSGSWDEDDQQFDPKRRIILFEAKKLPQVLSKVKEFLS
nr:EOG090X0C3Y [Macrothrix elegans]